METWVKWLLSVKRSSVVEDGRTSKIGSHEITIICGKLSMLNELAISGEP